MAEAEDDGLIDGVCAACGARAWLQRGEAPLCWWCADAEAPCVAPEPAPQGLSAFGLEVLGWAGQKGACEMGATWDVSEDELALITETGSDCLARGWSVSDAVRYAMLAQYAGHDQYMAELRRLRAARDARDARGLVRA